MHCLWSTIIFFLVFMNGGGRVNGEALVPLYGNLVNKERDCLTKPICVFFGPIDSILSTIRLTVSFITRKFLGRTLREPSTTNIRSIERCRHITADRK